MNMINAITTIANSSSVVIRIICLLLLLLLFLSCDYDCFIHMALIIIISSYY